MMQALKHIRSNSWAVYAAVLCVLMLIPNNAWAAENIIDAAAQGPGAFISYLLLEPLVDLIQNVLAPVLREMFRWGLDWMTIPYVNTVIIWLQGLAILGAIIVRIYVGLRSGILQDGGSNEYTLEAFLGKSFASIILVALMPTLCRLVIEFGHSMFNYVTGITGNVDAALAWLDLSGLDSDALVSNAALNALWLIILVIVIFAMVTACGYQFIRRQVEMLTVCIIAPIVSVYAATEDSSGQVGDLLRNLFGLVAQQFIQYILCMIALGFGQSWLTLFIARGTEEGWLVFGSTEIIQAFMFCIATFMAALTIPKLVDRYTFGASGSHVGGVLVSQAIMSMRRLRVPFIGRR